MKMVSRCGVYGLSAVLSGLAAFPALGQWTDVTPIEMTGGNTRGGSWIDYDKDGDLDLYVTRWADINLLFRNDGGDTFTVVVDENLSLFNSTHLSGRASWADIDNDGDADVFVAQSLGNRLVRNDGPGGFTTLSTGQAIQLSGRVSRSGAWGDYDGDGLVDLYIASNGGPDVVGSRLFHNDGNGQFSDVGEATGTNDTGVGRSATWVDYDGDGDLDLYLTNGSSVDGDLENPDRVINRLFENTGSGFISVETDPIDVPTHSRGACWGDFDNDGDFDVYVTAIRVNTGGCCLPDSTCVIQSRHNCEDNMGGVFLGNDTTCVGDPCGVAATAPGHGRGTSSSKRSFSQVGPPPDGQNVLLRNDGGVFTDISSGMTALNGLTRDASWVDVDNDGDLDLFIVPIGQPPRLLRNDGGSFTVNIASGALIANVGSANVAAWGDYDEDGDMDVFLGYDNSTDSALLRNDLSNGNHWLEVELVGTLSNRSAIGAVVKLTAGGVTQMRQIESGSSYFAQHMLYAHFGLGATSTIDSVMVRWPSGQTQTVLGIAVDQRVTLVEPCNPGVNCADCNMNGTSDVEELTTGAAEDCNWNGVPDDCETVEDCNGNGIPDFCELVFPSVDCDNSGVLDECEIAAGEGVDCDGNSIMDACELDDGFPEFVLINTSSAPDATYLGPPDGVVAGLDGNEVVFDFVAMRVADGDGPDLTVYEGIIGNPEFANIDVLISENGVDFVSIKATESFPPTRIPGDEAVGDVFARSYDLAGSGLTAVRWVKIDSAPPPGTSNGLDLDAIGAVNQTLGVCVGGSCPEDCVPAPLGNGVVNIDDLLSVVAAFGSSDPQCDVAPDNGDGTFGNGVVNIDDVLAVISAFGPCD